MDPNRIGLFDLAEQRLAWVNRRQAVLAENIANVNTPGFKAHDLQPFASALANADVVEPVQTQPNHLPGTASTDAPDEVADRTQAQSPDGNAVSMDQQLVKLADTETSHELVTAIYKKYLGLFSMALGQPPSG